MVIALFLLKKKKTCAVFLNSNHETKSTSMLWLVKKNRRTELWQNAKIGLSLPEKVWTLAVACCNRILWIMGNYGIPKFEHTNPENGTSVKGFHPPLAKRTAHKPWCDSQKYVSQLADHFEWRHSSHNAHRVSTARLAREMGPPALHFRLLVDDFGNDDLLTLELETWENEILWN